MLHPVGRSSNSDWFVNSFIMVVYEKIFSRSLGHQIMTELKKSFSQTTIIKLFRNQSELKDLPTGCVSKK